MQISLLRLRCLRVEPGARIIALKLVRREILHDQPVQLFASTPLQVDRLCTFALFAQVVVLESAELGAD